MAFKLKSPFNVTEVKPTLGKGGVVGQGSSSSVVKGLENTDVASVEGNQTVKPEVNNKVVDNLVKKVDEGIPLDLNPKQEARFKTRKYKKGIRDTKKFDRQTEKAKKIYKRNEFEGLQNLDEKGYIIPEGKEGAGTTYYNPDAAEQEKDKRYKDAFNRKWKATEDYAKASQDAAAGIRRIEDKIAGKVVENWGNPAPKMLDMEKPNRAGTPVRMLKSMEDTTPMKYKSVRKAGRENLMSALAKKGEPIDVKKVIKKVAYNMIGGPAIDAISTIVKDKKPTMSREAYNTPEPKSSSQKSKFVATPGTEFKATETGKSNQPGRVTVGDRAKESVKKAIKLSVGAATLKKGEPKKKEMTNDFTTNLESSQKINLGPGPKKKATPKKADMKKSKNKSKSGKVTVNRKVSTKF